MYIKQISNHHQGHILAKRNPFQPLISLFQTIDLQTPINYGLTIWSPNIEQSPNKNPVITKSC